ncbi:MAG: NAD(P)-binding domain-containing protein [Actinobacteria bacterium]|nr:NAD(P)-binding domain-containing protein [Actinomycetota bacterium]
MVERIGVIGAGLMGHGIAQVFAGAGARVRVFDPSPEALRSLRPRVESNLNVLGLPTDAVENIEPVSSVAAAAGGAELVVEAAPEDVGCKRAVFAELAEVAEVDAILATNTSVISIGEVAAGQAAVDRIVGTHWWNPPYLVPLVEVIEHPEVDPAVVERTLAILGAVGKTAIHVRRDIPGFVGNRLQHAMWREALALVDAGVCEPQEIDTVVRSGFGARLGAVGPIENADLVGLDLTEAIHAYLLPHLDSSTEPAAGLRERVGRGELGARSGRGYLDWEAGDADAVRDRMVVQLRGVEAARR